MNELCNFIYFLTYAIHCLSLYRDQVRTGFLKDGKPIKLTQGQEITITIVYTIKGDESMISMSYQKLAINMKPGSTILCADGTITLTTLSCDPQQGLIFSVIHA